MSFTWTRTTPPTPMCDRAVRSATGSGRWRRGKSNRTPQRGQIAAGMPMSPRLAHDVSRGPETPAETPNIAWALIARSVAVGVHRLPLERGQARLTIAVACLVGMLVSGRALDREQQGAKVFGHPLDDGRVGLSQQVPFRHRIHGHDALGVLLAGRGKGDEDLPPVARVDVAPDQPLAFQTGHPVGDRPGRNLRAAEQLA